MAVDLDSERAIEDGRDAVLIKGMISPYIYDRVNLIIRSMVSNYRGGSADYVTLVGSIAEISGLYYLLDNLDAQERRGNVAMERQNAQAKIRDI